MCYEQTFFRRLLSKKGQKVEESKPVIERAPPAAQPAQTKPATPTRRPKEVEVEVETV